MTDSSVVGPKKDDAAVLEDAFLLSDETGRTGASAPSGRFPRIESRVSDIEPVSRNTNGGNRSRLVTGDNGGVDVLEPSRLLAVLDDERRSTSSISFTTDEGRRFTSFLPGGDGDGVGDLTFGEDENALGRLMPPCSGCCMR